MSTERNPKGGPPPAHAGQNKIINLDARYKIAVCGRRFGKTVAAAIAAINLCKNTDLPNQRVWWISPIQEQSDRVERQMVDWLFRDIKGYKPPENEKNEKIDAKWEHRRQEHALINLNTRSRIEFHSAHVPDRLRGAGLDLVIVDEAADISEYTWKMVLKPMLLESSGKAIITGTPRGKQHWLHRVFLLGQQPEHASLYASVQLPTTENKLLDRTEIESFRAEMTPDEFRQEFEAEFLDGVDSVFTNLAGCTGGELLPRGRAGDPYITGIDLGDKKDFTVLASLNCRTRQLEGFARFNQCGWNEQIARIKDHLKRFRGPCVVDTTGLGDPVLTLLWNAYRGLITPFKFTADSKCFVVRGLQIAFSNSELTIPAIPELQNELSAFTRLDEPASSFSPHPRYGAPPGFHDDCVIALALAWYGRTELGLWAVSSDNPIREGFFA